jgi:hypothetical protein
MLMIPTLQNPEGRKRVVLARGWGRRGMNR